MELLFATDPSLALLIVRVVLGVIFFAHGAQKSSRLVWLGHIDRRSRRVFDRSLARALVTSAAFDHQTSVVAADSAKIYSQG